MTAICLTARRAATRSELSGLWADWQRLGPEVAAWVGTEPGRLTSVVQSIALSLQSSRMTAEAHRLFAFLGQCPAGLAPADRRALLGDAAGPAEDALVSVGLAHHPRDRRDRLDLLPPVRDHARLRHAPANEDAVRWCRHFLDRARVEGERIFRDGGAEALAALTPEIATLDAALRAADHLSLRAEAVAALDGVYRLLSASGAGSPAVFDAVAAACRVVGDAAGEAWSHFYHGVVAFDRSDHDGARARFEQALPLFRKVSSMWGEANCVRGLGHVARGQGDTAAARARFEAALALDQQIHATHSIAIVHEDLANVTRDAERAGHVRAAKEAWASMDLPDQVARVTREFG